MAKVEIIGPKNLFFEVLSMLHENGRLHIEDLSDKIRSGELPLERMELYDQQIRDEERMEELLIRVRSILKTLHREKTPIDKVELKREYERMYALDPQGLADEVAHVIAEVEEETAALASKHTSIESELALLNRYEPILAKIQPLARQIVTTGTYGSVALLVERRYKGALEQLKEELDRITNKQCEIVSADVDEDTTAVIVVYNKAYSDPVHAFLAMENVNQIRLPGEFEDMPFDVAYDELKQRQQALPGELEVVSERLDVMSCDWQLRMTAIRDVLADKIEEIRTIPKFGRTAYAFVVTGWLPAAEVKELRRQLHEKWGDEIILEKKEIAETEYEETPVAVKNPKAVAPFEKLINVRGVPRYGTIDPTWMLFIFFPLFYGMIVGDFGYGAVMLGVIIWLRRKFRENEIIQIATAVLGPAATMVVAFGLAYGEFFGDVPLRLGWIQVDPVTHAASWFGVIPTFHRVEEIMPFMMIALVVGVVHILFGLALGITNAIRTGHRKHTMERGGIMIFVIGALVLVASFQQFVTDAVGDTTALLLQAGVAVVAFGGFFYAIKGGGVMGAVEVLEALSGIASYIRIMAVGLAGALFADAINQVVLIMGNPVIGALIGIVLHSLHIVIAAFSPLIHALRLNLLEFFGKFYETGRQPYSPFMKTGGEESA